MKEKVILYYFPYKRLKPVYDALSKRSDMLILVDFDPEEYNLSLDHFRKAENLLPKEQIRAQADQETKKRLPSLISHFRSHLSDLPYSNHLLPADIEHLETCYKNSVGEALYHYYLFKELRKRFDIRLAVTSLSMLDKNRAVLSAAKADNIPTLHIQHGSYPQPDYRFPEVADVVAIADNLGAQVIKATKRSLAKVIVTGLPFATDCLNPPMSSREDKALKENARKKLNIPQDESVILYLTTWTESLYISRILFSYKLVESLQMVFAAAKEREDKGLKTRVLVRQHPSIVKYESKEAITLLGDSVGFSNISFASKDRDLAFQASDIVVTDDVRSSAVLDAFSAGRAVIGITLFPKIPHEEGDRLIGKYLTEVKTDSDLRKAFSEYLDNPKNCREKEELVFEFMKGLRLISKDQSIENLCSLILGLANNGLAFLDKDAKQKTLAQSDTVLNCSSL